MSLQFSAEVGRAVAESEGNGISLPLQIGSCALVGTMLLYLGINMRREYVKSVQPLKERAEAERIAVETGPTSMS